MKKAILIPVCAVLLAGCGDDVSLDGRLGGSESSFVEVHGPNQQEEDAEGLSALFDYISESGVAAAFIQDHAIVIVLSLSNEGNGGLPLDEALAYTSDFIPEDAELVEENEVMLTKVYLYESSSLDEAIGGGDTDTQAFSIILEADGEDNYITAQIQTDHLEEEE